MTFTASTYEAIDEGVYPGQLVSIETQPGETYGDFLIWNFRLRLPDGTVNDISGASSKATGPKSKAYRWATALLGRTPAPGAAEDLSGKVCQLHVIVNEEGFNRIEAVLPAAKSAVLPAPAPAFPDSPPARLEPSAAAASDLPF